jgi:perosamine synthetase
LHPRHRIDITFADLAFGLGACLWVWQRDRLVEQIERHIGPPEDAIVCLSVRSAFDLVLDSLELTPSSEVLVSAITHPDMLGILEPHGLRPVPVDLDLGTLEPRADVLQAAVTDRTRMILVAHLFGATVDLRPTADVARRHGLLLVEDCAQCLTDAKARGDPLADISMFSFGPIKTSTALGGAIVRVQSPELRERMRRTLAACPVQPRRQVLRRTAKFSLLGLLAHPLAFGLFVRACKLSGRDLDQLLSALVRGFKASYHDPEFVARIRRGPSAPLLARGDVAARCGPASTPRNVGCLHAIGPRKSEPQRP